MVGWWLWGKDALDVWLDALFPPCCAGCGRPGAHFCPKCVAALKPVRPPWCATCGQSLPVSAVRPTGFRAGGTPFLADQRCADCRVRPLPLVAVRSAGVFDGSLRTAIHRLKYRGRRSAARSLGDLMVAPARELRTGWPAPDPRAPTRTIVVPVPLHPRRERERGYNQAALLAAPVAQALGWPLDARALRRVKDTTPLVGLREVERVAAVADAFAATRNLDRAHVLLVDDVATTCSTLAAAARACLAASAASVAAITLAREPKREPGPVRAQTA